MSTLTEKIISIKTETQIGGITPRRIGEVLELLDNHFGPYTSVANACAKVPVAIRTIGKTVGIINGGNINEYWWKNGTRDSDLVAKDSGLRAVGANSILLKKADNTFGSAKITMSESAGGVVKYTPDNVTAPFLTLKQHTDRTGVPEGEYGGVPCKKLQLTANEIYIGRVTEDEDFNANPVRRFGVGFRQQSDLFSAYYNNYHKQDMMSVATRTGIATFGMNTNEVYIGRKLITDGVLPPTGSVNTFIGTKADKVVLGDYTNAVYVGRYSTNTFLGLTSKHLKIGGHNDNTQVVTIYRGGTSSSPQDAFRVFQATETETKLFNTSAHVFSLKSNMELKVNASNVISVSNTADKPITIGNKTRNNTKIEGISTINIATGGNFINMVNTYSEHDYTQIFSPTLYVGMINGQNKPTQNIFVSYKRFGDVFRTDTVSDNYYFLASDSRRNNSSRVQKVRVGEYAHDIEVGSNAIDVYLGYKSTSVSIGKDSLSTTIGENSAGVYIGTGGQRTSIEGSDIFIKTPTVALPASAAHFLALWSGTKLVKIRREDMFANHYTKAEIDAKLEVINNRVTEIYNRFN